MDAVKQRIEELCQERGLTINALANQSALAPSTIKNIIYNVSKNPGIGTIKMICDGLDISLIEFFDAEVFRNLEQEIE